MVELNHEERPVSKKRKLIGGNLATRTMSATKAAVGGGNQHVEEVDQVEDITTRTMSAGFRH